jgi:hypothetical protein
VTAAEAAGRQRGEEVKRAMAIDERIRKTWIDVQKKHDVPVNAIGMKIDAKDANALRVWKEEGIDKFVKQ